jgi:hypothetical protein
MVLLVEVEQEVAAMEEIHHQPEQPLLAQQPVQEAQELAQIYLEL